MLIKENEITSCGKIQEKKRLTNASVQISSGGKTSFAPLCSLGKDIVIDSSDE